MKSIVEVTKINEEELPQIYCDMDMVLCDFIGGYEQLTGKQFEKTPKDERWGEIKGKKDFWHTLPWMPGAQRMWKLINKYNANILSAYSNRDGNSRKGKKSWLSKNAKPTGKIHLVQRADKQKYATTDGKPNILIDDYLKNIKEWESAGGIGIHHTSPTNTISQLKRNGFR
jgi:5'(3')-deoxyribonucleotidase